MVPSHHVHIILSIERGMKFCQPPNITILIYPFFKWFESSYQIDLIHKSHNVPVLYPTMRNRNVHISILNGVLWDMELVHCGICEIALSIWLVSSNLSCNVNPEMHLEKNTWIKLFMQNDFTVVLKIFTADIEYQFFQRSWHIIVTSDVSLSPWSIPDMHQIIHKHTEIDSPKAILFFFYFWIVECFKCIIRYMRLCQQSQATFVLC